VALFGAEFQQVASCLFGAVSVGLVWLLLGRFSLDVRRRLALTVVFGFGTVLWYVAETGSAWYIGHASAVMFSAGAVLLALDRRWPVLVGLLLGLAAISRLPIALACVGVLMLALGMGWPLRLPADRAMAIRRTVAFGIGMAVPVGSYFAYNLARWGTLMDEGYTRSRASSRTHLREVRDLRHRVHSPPHPRHLPSVVELRGRPPFFQPSWWGSACSHHAAPHLARAGPPAGSAGAGLGRRDRPRGHPDRDPRQRRIAQFGYRFSLDTQVFLFVILATVFERGCHACMVAAARRSRSAPTPSGRSRSSSWPSDFSLARREAVAWQGGAEHGAKPVRERARAGANAARRG
jgi:hypothetical protein